MSKDVCIPGIACCSILLAATSLMAQGLDLNAVGSWPGFMRGPATSVDVVGEYAYVGTLEAGLHVFDISDPDNPIAVGTYETEGWARGIVLSGDYAFVAAGDLEVVDIKDPTDPQRVARHTTPPDFAEDLALMGDYVYVADNNGGLHVVRATPVEVYLSGVQGSEGAIVLRLEGAAGTTLNLQYSLDLQTWQTWQTLTLKNEPVELTDPDAAGYGQRFYRAVSP